MNLIEDLLTVSRLEAGTFGLSIAPIELEPIIASAREAVQPAALESGVELTVSVPEDAGIVMGDAGQLERAILNVLSNAIKFTPAGGSVSLEAKRANGQLLVSVHDTGVGISGEDLPKLFRPFFRSSSTYKQAVPGTGLGLVIVKSILEGHKGSVDVSSTPGEGTTVTLRIPVADN
jgi:signal transduction histidine kinase